ncbi:MAG: translocation/assembly module TamB domain-containing protein, partial [Candidatus Kapaibacterium sp.]
IARDLELTVIGFPLQDGLNLAPGSTPQQFESVDGTIDTLKVRINKNIKSPLIESSISAKDLIFNRRKIDNIQAKLTHKNAVVSGSVNVIEIFEDRNTLPLEIQIRSLPLDLSMDAVGERLHNRAKIDIVARANDAPLELAGPFVPPLERLRGNFDAEVSVTGPSIEEIDYKGYVNITRSEFVLMATNIRYTAEGRIDLSKDHLDIKGLKLRNIQEDLPSGQAKISGSVDLKNFSPEYLDITIESDRLLVLSDASMKPMPTLYGRFIIATGEEPFRFYGTLQKPNLTGYINILDASLVMPKMVGSVDTRSEFRYEYADRTIRVMREDPDSIARVEDKIAPQNQNGKKKEAAESGPGIADLINYDLWIRFPGRFDMTMDLGSLGELFVIIGTKTRESAVHYVKERSSTDAKLYGEIVVKEGSKLKTTVKTLETTGSISFPTGNISNPTLDLKATYSGESYVDNRTRNYTVTIEITGTKEVPNINFSYTINGVPATGDPKKIEEDALFLLLTGRTSDEFMTTGGGEQSVIGSLGSSAVSALASKSLSELLLGTGVFQSAEVDVAGEGLEETRVKVTGRLYKSVSWTVGGTVADITSNNEIQIDIPLSAFFDAEFFNNFILQLTTSTNTTATQRFDQKEWEVKIKFGGSW